MRHAGTLATLTMSALLAAPGAAGAQNVEEILSYDVSVDVREDARLEVTEVITVRALGQEIRRGIYRDFPTSFPRAFGLARTEAPFRVLAVLKDGIREPYSVSSIGGPSRRGGVRIRIGSENVFLDPAVYTYTIRYETERWVVFGDAEDQLYWNATGNGWGFAIQAASARVRIEGLDEAPTMEAWIGYEGSTERSVAQRWDGGALTAVFETDRRLEPNEGLTLRVTFPSGVLIPPSEETLATWFRLDWGGYIDAGYLFLLVVAIYLLMWRQVGVDPVGRPEGYRTAPPEGFSPAALGYLQERGYEQSQLAASLVSMAMKGAIRIERRDDASWFIHKVDPEVDIAPEERKVFQALLSGREVIEVKRSRHQELSKAIKGLKSALGRTLEREYFVNNRRWFVAGLAISLVGFGGLTWRWRFAIEPHAWFLGLWLTLWTVGTATLVVRVVGALRHAGSGAGPLAWGGALGMLLFSLPFVLAEIVVLVILATAAPFHLLLAAVALGLTNVAFYHLLERPTLKGRGVLDQLDGFKAFLSAEGESARARAPHEARSPELFERYLPHAIALGLETRWAEGFGDALRPGDGVPQGHIMPWYHHHHDAFDARTFATSLGSSLPSTLSSSSTPPSSGGSGGGGFSGGGSSGGGGGGGGGGGW